MTLFKAFLVAASIVSSNGAPTENLAGRRVIPLVPIRAVPSLQLKTIDHPQYQFGYTISDTETGDAKTRQETRDGDLVTGSYSVLQSDGRLRTVTYSADDVHGFTAKVTYDGEEGPSAIPYDPPTAVAVTDQVDVVAAVKEVQVAPSVKSVPEAAIVSSPVSQVQSSSNPVIRTIPTPFVTQHPRHRLASPVSVVRTFPSSHLLHNAASPASVLRSIPSSHFFHNSPSPVSVVRTLPTSHGLQSSSSPVSVVRAVPSSHFLHNTDSPVSVVRTVPSSHVLQSSASPVSVFRSVPSSHFGVPVFRQLGGGQRAGGVVANHGIHLTQNETPVFQHITNSDLQHLTNRNLQHLTNSNLQHFTNSNLQHLTNRNLQEGPVFQHFSNSNLQFPLVHSSHQEPFDLSQFRFVSAAQVLPAY